MLIFLKKCMKKFGTFFSITETIPISPRLWSYHDTLSSKSSSLREWMIGLLPAAGDAVTLWKQQVIFYPSTYS